MSQDRLSDFPFDHRIRLFASQMLGHMDIFDPDCIGHWAQCVEWRDDFGFLVYVGRERWTVLVENKRVEWEREHFPKEGDESHNDIRPAFSFVETLSQDWRMRRKLPKDFASIDEGTAVRIWRRLEKDKQIPQEGMPDVKSLDKALQMEILGGVRY